MLMLYIYILLSRYIYILIYLEVKVYAKFSFIYPRINVYYVFLFVSFKVRSGLPLSYTHLKGKKY